MEEDERREAAIASNSCLRPNSTSSGITQEQLAKFRELQRRRLQMKTKSKKKSKPKGSSDANVKGKFLSRDLNAKGSPNENTNQRSNSPNDNSGSSKSDEKSEVTSSSPQVEVHPALKKKKLHWGLDAKERWERKANM